MSDEVRTVGDLSGKHVGTDTVRISLFESEIVGVITDLTFSTGYQLTLSGDRRGEALAHIGLDGGVELNSVPLSTPASAVARSGPQ